MLERHHGGEREGGTPDEEASLMHTPRECSDADSLTITLVVAENKVIGGPRRSSYMNNDQQSFIKIYKHILPCVTLQYI